MTSEFLDNDTFLKEPLTFGSVMRRTLAMARSHGAAFMRVLLLPVGKVLLGFYGSLAGSLFISQWATQPERLLFFQQYSVLFIALLLVILLLGLGLCFQGFWEYLIYSVSLCRNVREVSETHSENRPPDFKTAYLEIDRHRKALLARWAGIVLVLLPLFPLLPAVGLPLLTALIPQLPIGVMALSVLAGLLLGGLLGLVWLVMQILLTYGLQALALTEAPSNVMTLAQDSMRLTRQRPWLTLGLQVVLFLCTNYLFTVPLVALLRFARLLAPLDDLHGWLSGILLADGMEQMTHLDLGALGAPLLAQLESLRPSLVSGLTDAAVGGSITLLLLPLGTMAFTLVYGHAQANAGATVGKTVEPDR
jgi:hypothetical protein